MSDLTHLFTVGQKVRIKNDDFDSKRKWDKGTIKETYPDHIIVHFDEFDYDGYFEHGFGLDRVFPEYNF